MTPRAVAVVPAALLALAASALPGLAPSVQAAPKDPDGHYAGTETPEEANGLDDVVLTFDVKGNGRKIKDFTIAMNVVCSGYPLYVEYVVQPMDDMRVNPRTGRFRDVVEGATEGGTGYRVEVAGRLRGTKVRQGTMSYDVGICQRGTGDEGPVEWKGSRESK